ncbi:hypothetical protein F5Y14DRAFT_163158 [Nemania sp. NC0429]|nr:hypothetical protein F5Y14DRAFT_163158 [Nemania sp. NC0429]
MPTPATTPIPRRRACFACADVKRACDRKLPICQRCLDRDVECVYPTSRSQRPGWAGSGQLDSLLNHADPNELAIADWGAIDNSSADIHFPELAFPSIPSVQQTQQLCTSTLVSGSLFGPETPPCPWWLEPNSWMIQHGNDMQPSSDPVDPEEFIGGIQQMLQSWVAAGQNGFIHQRLYRKGLPRCLQDAYTTLSSYNNRTATMKTTILEIAHERETALVRERYLPVEDAEGVLSHLARIHALFVYLCIQLFDDSIRHRALAERQISTLVLWTTQMWDAITRSQDVQNPYRGMLPQPGSTRRVSRNLEAELWRSWILAESARRTFIIVSFMTSTYLTVRDGWADCKGGVMMTARRDLWDAQSASEWFGLCCENPPQLVSSLHPWQFMDENSAIGVDGFVTIIWTLLVGSEALRNWMA